MWKIGLFRSQYEDGYGERLGPYVDQLLNEEQASTKLKAGRPTQFIDLRTQYDLNEASEIIISHAVDIGYLRNTVPPAIIVTGHAMKRVMLRLHLHAKAHPVRAT